MIRPLLPSLLMLLFALSSARAELPTLRFLKLQPYGGEAGSDVEVTVSGAEFDTADTLMFDQPGITATLIKPSGSPQFKVSIAQSVPEGTYDVWVVGKYGISNPRLFAVSHGLKELAPKQRLSDPQKPLLVEVNSAINSFSDIEGQYFRVDAKKGERFTFDCLSQRLMSLGGSGTPAAEMTLALLNEQGQTLASCGHYFGNDPFLDYVFPADGPYLLRVEEAKYSPGQQYRLIISNRPHLENAFPRAIEIGKPTDVTVYGRNLGPGSKPSAWEIDGLPLEEKQLSLTLSPDSPDGSYVLRYSEHPTGFSFPVTNCTATVRGTQIRPDWNGGAQNTATLVYAETPPILEREPNDTREQAQTIPLPAIVNGRFDHPGDVDWYRVDVSKEQEGKYQLQVYCDRIGGRADPYIAVYDDKGNRVIELDDSNFSIDQTEGRNRDPFGVADFSGKRSYFIMVKDLFGRGGARFQYVLSLHKATRDFYVVATAPFMSIGGQGHACGTTVRRGGTVRIILAAYYDGITCPVTVTADELPPGMHASVCKLPGGRPGQVSSMVLSADTDAPDWAGPIHMTATAEVDGQTIRRPVIYCTRASGSNATGGRTTRSMMVAIRDASPFLLRVEPSQITVSPGGTADLKFLVTRNSPGFKAGIQIDKTEDTTLGGAFASLVIAAGENEKPFTLEVPKNVTPGDYVVCFRGIAPVSFVRNPGKSEKEEEVKVYDPALPLYVKVIPEKK